MLSDLLRDLLLVHDWKAVVRALLEMGLIYVMLYAVLRFMQGTRGAGMLRGLAFFLVVASVTVLFLVKWLELHAIGWLVSGFLPLFIIPILIVFQPELRRALLRLGHNPLFRLFFRADTGVLDEVVKAVVALSTSKVGGLVVMEREVGLTTFAEGGVQLDSEVKAELINTIFWPGSPLHDGAVIVQENRVAAAGCLLPFTENAEISRSLGTRHRAGVGITEETDAISIIVSEETGQISVAARGKMTRSLNADELRKALEEFLAEGATSPEEAAQADQ